MRTTKRAPQSVTALPISPTRERRRRVVNYSIAMGIRVVCVLACLFVHGWWLVVPILGALVLPYIAVVIANVGPGENAGVVERPGAIVPVRPTPYAPTSAGSQEPFDDRAP